jgi:hypothetical protein
MRFLIFLIGCRKFNILNVLLHSNIGETYLIYVIRPLVTYSSETWTLTAKDENNLRIFERQILRKIFGLVNTGNIWRIRNNMETDKLTEGADIVRFIKAQRIK